MEIKLYRNNHVIKLPRNNTDWSPCLPRWLIVTIFYPNFEQRLVLCKPKQEILNNIINSIRFFNCFNSIIETNLSAVNKFYV